VRKVAGDLEVTRLERGQLRQNPPGESDERPGHGAGVGVEPVALEFLPPARWTSQMRSGAARRAPPPHRWRPFCSFAQRLWRSRTMPQSAASATPPRGAVAHLSGARLQVFHPGPRRRTARQVRGHGVDRGDRGGTPAGVWSGGSRNRWRRTSGPAARLRRRCSLAQGRSQALDISTKSGRWRGSGAGSPRWENPPHGRASAGAGRAADPGPTGPADTVRGIGRRGPEGFRLDLDDRDEIGLRRESRLHGAGV